MQDTRKIIVEDRPEADPLVRFRAHYKNSPNGLAGWGATISAAEEDLANEEAQYMAEKLDRAEHGESHWWEVAA